MKKYSLDDKYNTYKKWYLQQEEKVRRQGQPMYSPMYSKSQFESVYNETKTDLKMLTESGNRKGVGNVYQYMVREQAYPISYGMEKGLKEAYKEAGVKPTFNRFSTYEDIRNEAPQAVWDVIERTYEQLRADGFKGSEAALMISQIFFGSD